MVPSDPLGGPVLGGVQGAEALVKAGGVQRGAQAGRHDARNVGTGREQFLQVLLALDGSGSPRRTAPIPPCPGSWWRQPGW